MPRWVCPICGKQLKPRGTINSHMKKHNSTVTVVLSCKSCGKPIEVTGKTSKDAQLLAKFHLGLCRSCLERNKNKYDMGF